MSGPTAANWCSILAPFHVVDGDEGGFAAHRQAHIALLEFFIDQMAEGFDFLPLLGRVGLGDARVFINAPARTLIT